MAPTINSNAQVSRSPLTQSQAKITKSLARLSTGIRINSAKDDAAGLAISDRMNSQIRGLNQAVRNANDGISLMQTTEGALGETTGMLQRMRELAVQSSNGMYNDDDRASMNAEFSQLQSELDRIAGTTEFNGKSVLDGSLSATGETFQVGPDAGETLEVTVGAADQAALGTATLNIGTFGGAQDAISAIDSAIEKVSSIRGGLGANQNRLESSINNLSNSAENIAAANSRIADADFAFEVSQLAQNRVREQAGVAMQAQANQSAQTVLSLLA